MADSGRVLDGLDVIGAAAKASRVATALTVSTPGSIDAAAVRLTILSGDLDGADHLIAALGVQPEYKIDPFIRGYLLLSAGRIALLRGRPLTARQHFAEGRAVGLGQLADTDPRGHDVRDVGGVVEPEEVTDLVQRDRPDGGGAEGVALRVVEGERDVALDDPPAVIASPAGLPADGLVEPLAPCDMAVRAD